ncbi:glycosyl transferases group 1 domain-containing protein [Sarocladium implicatum]|nr:glycosyl transferases group 1 domain-containing protein [Sarocladium implicatum]
MPPVDPPDEDVQDQRTVVFFHPDLGIGGAERLVVDAAVGLQSRGYRVVIFTNHCDPSHCFDECRDGTLDVRVRGAWLIPPSILSRLTILCAILRHIHLLIAIYLSSELPALKPTAFFVDQLSAGLPLLQYFQPSTPILFYCHFPDLLLARGRETSALKRAYRVPFDWLEEWSMGFAQAIAVNSEFTKRVVEKTWPGLTSQVATKVIYPCVDTDVKAVDDTKLPGELKNQKIILSINRFERKKDVGLAIKAFAAIPEAKRKSARLVIAGGYDSRITENVEYYTELQELATSLSLSHHTTSNLDTSPPSCPVLFLLSVPTPLKLALLSSARLLIYTPSNEHFGIVPLEAMLSSVPVLAANTGGPVETVLDGQTGWLRSPDDVTGWTSVVVRALELSEKQVAAMGSKGRERVQRMFGREKMAESLEGTVDEIVELKRPPPMMNAVLNFLGIALVFVLGLGTSKVFASLHGKS